MNPASLHLIRHGETEWNVQGIYQGHLDSPLTEKGKRQARSLAPRIESHGWEAIYCSDLGRCRISAELILGERAKDIEFREALRERHLGIFQGLVKNEAMGKFPREFASFISRDPGYRLPKGGESLLDKHARFTRSLADICRTHPGGRILVISHGGALDSLLRECLHLDLTAPRRFEIANLAWNHFRYDGRSWQLVTWGDVSHLELDTTADTEALDV